jgi:hypothetical protein
MHLTGLFNNAVPILDYMLWNLKLSFPNRDKEWLKLLSVNCLAQTPSSHGSRSDRQAIQPAYKKPEYL